jgi:hypothetical protein
MIRNQPEHLARLGMTAERLLGEHDRVIHGHFKHTTARGSQPDLRFWPTIPQRGRQTDGPGFVVSDGTEFYRQTHWNRQMRGSTKDERWGAKASATTHDFILNPSSSILHLTYGTPVTFAIR